MPFEIVNYYDKLKKPKNDEKPIDHSYPNEAEINITLPCRALICAPSGTGKTNLLRNILDAIGIWTRIVIWAKDLEEPLYADLIEKCRKAERKHKCEIITAITDAKDLPDVDSFDKKTHNLLICDDLITEDKKNLALLDPYFVRGRKKEISMFFLTQGYFDVPKKIRKNINYLIIKKIKNTLDLNRILREYSLDIKPEQMQAMYQYAMRGDPHTSFFMLDIETKNPDLQYRANFEPIFPQ